MCDFLVGVSYYLLKSRPGELMCLRVDSPKLTNGRPIQGYPKVARYQSTSLNSVCVCKLNFCVNFQYL